MPLMISVLSYAGSVSIMMLCDTNVVTDVDGLVEAVEHELSSNLEKASVSPHVPVCSHEWKARTLYWWAWISRAVILMHAGAARSR